MFGVYKRYPFPIPARVKFFNLVRFIFKFPWLESFLVSQLAQGNLWWKKFTPPLYLYSNESIRVVRRQELNCRLDISKLLDHSIYFYNEYDVAWKNLFKILKPDFGVIDAGANIGWLSLNFARDCSQGFVYSFEPDSKNFSSLQKNVELNNFHNIKLFNVALGAEKGVGQLYKLYVNNPGANRILSASPAAPIHSEMVEITTLDELNKQKSFQRIDLMKIDVEGYELFVLKGAQKLIEEWKPLLFVELAEVNLNQQNETALDLIDYVENLGYNVLNAQTLRPIDRLIKDYHTDIICIPKSVEVSSILES